MSSNPSDSSPSGRRRPQTDHATTLRVVVLPVADVTPAQDAAVRRLQETCFGSTPLVELLEDYVAAPVARVLAADGGDLVGYVSVFVRELVYEGDRVRLGGLGGTCTRADRRRQGIGTAVCRAGMAWLHQAGCDVAFLPAAPGTEPFYKQFGFVPLSTPYTFVNVHGATKPPSATAGTAMLAPVRSRAWFDRIRGGASPFHLGPEKGYW